MKIGAAILERNWKQYLLFIAAAGMVIGLLLPRAVLSTSMIVFIITSFVHKEWSTQARQFFRSPALWGMSLLFILPLVSGLWSDDKVRWMDVIRIKLPLLFLPLAFSSPVTLKKRDCIILVWVLLLVTTAGSLISIADYSMNIQKIHQDYLQAKMMFTPFENDHIRFSWLVSISILLGCWLISLKLKANKSRSFTIILLIVLAWLVVYLHILAARTGLITLYLFILLAAAWWLIKKGKPSYIITGIILLIVLPLTAYFTFPTFKNRIKYIIYDASYYTKSQYLPGSNDGSRYFSILAGLHTLQSQPLTGVGFGDIPFVTNRWYDKNVPEMPAQARLLPHSEWLMYGNGCGWPGVLIFSLSMILPFFSKHHRRELIWWLLNISAALIFLFDIGLEIQFGVFCYSFVVLWIWKWISLKNSE